MAPVQPGHVVQGWTLDHSIGSGTFATVWKAHKQTQDETLTAAVKVILTNRLSVKLLQSLECEVSILKRINHSNVVQLYEVVEARLNSHASFLYKAEAVKSAACPLRMKLGDISYYVGEGQDVFGDGVLQRRRPRRISAQTAAHVRGDSARLYAAAFDGAAGAVEAPLRAREVCPTQLSSMRLADSPLSAFCRAEGPQAAEPAVVEHVCRTHHKDRRLRVRAGPAAAAHGGYPLRVSALHGARDSAVP